MFDEADYVTAVRRGLAAHYLDANAMPTLEIIKKGLCEVLFGEHAARAKEVREGHDINFYRQNHGALMFYLLALAGSLFGMEAVGFRIVAWLTAVLIVLATYWGLRLVVGEKGR